MIGTFGGISTLFFNLIGLLATRPMSGAVGNKRIVSRTHKSVNDSLSSSS